VVVQEISSIIARNTCNRKCVSFMGMIHIFHRDLHAHGGLRRRKSKGPKFIYASIKLL